MKAFLLVTLAACATSPATGSSDLASIVAGPFELHDTIAAQPGEDMADPGVLFDAGNVYRYATNAWFAHVPVTSSTSLTGPWSPPHDALPDLPSWVRGNIWAPEVAALDGAYYLYYAATIADDGSAFGEHAIGVAVSGSPDGPFWPVGDPLVRDPYGRGVIDPEVATINGTRWLVWSTDFGPGGRNSGLRRTIVAQQLVTPSQLGGTLWLLLEAGAPWEQNTVEAPAMAVDQFGVPYLFYSGANFDDASYGIGIARCASFPVAPCDRVAGPLAIPGARASAGGLDIVPAFFGAIGILHDGPLGNREDRFLPLSAAAQP